jgi:hypothetical protein
METVKEAIKLINNDWMLIFLAVTGTLAISKFFGVTTAWDQEKKRIILSPPVTRKIDSLLSLVLEMRLDIMALQIMNEHLLAAERHKIWIEYKRLGGNGFVDTYVAAYVSPLMREEIENNESK